jgi:hypothetical protein
MALTPLQAAEDCFKRARRLLTLSAADLPKGTLAAKVDLRRLALVMAVAGLDTFLHAMVLKRASKLRGKQLPGSWTKLDVPISDLAALAQAVVEARQVGRDSRPWVHVSNALHRRILRDGYQSAEGVAYAASLCGAKKVWKSLEQPLALKAEEIMRRLDSIVFRRNRIVHEGDLKRRVRPHKLRRNKLSFRLCVQSIDWLEALVRELDVVVNC